MLVNGESALKALFILNAAPYGSESTYNGIRLAAALARREHNVIRLYMMGDAVGTARTGQKVREGYYNLQLMLDQVVRAGSGNVSACGSCMDARGMTDEGLLEGTHRGTLEVV